jgi:hypothetical protein
MIRKNETVNELYAFLLKTLLSELWFCLVIGFIFTFCNNPLPILFERLNCGTVNSIFICCMPILYDKYSKYAQYCAKITISKKLKSISQWKFPSMFIRWHFVTACVHPSVLHLQNSSIKSEFGSSWHGLVEGFSVYSCILYKFHSLMRFFFLICVSSIRLTGPCELFWVRL